MCARYNIRQAVISGIYTLCFISLVPQVEFHDEPVFTALKIKANGRFNLYFYNREGIYNDYLDLIKRCEELDTESIALCAGGDSYVYPFLIYFKQKHDINIDETPLWDDPLDKDTKAP